MSPPPLRYALGKQCSRIYPCITPRFIPTCTIESMKGERGAQSMRGEEGAQPMQGEGDGQATQAQPMHALQSLDSWGPTICRNHTVTLPCSATLRVMPPFPFRASGPRPQAQGALVI